MKQIKVIITLEDGIEDGLEELKDDIEANLLDNYDEVKRVDFESLPDQD